MHQSGDSLAGGSGDEELGQVGGRGGGCWEEKAIGISMRHPHIVLTVSTVCQRRFAGPNSHRLDSFYRIILPVSQAV